MGDGGGRADAARALVDGMALAAAISAEEANDGAALPAFGACLAIVFHKPFDSLSIGTLMAGAGHTAKARHWFNAFYALVTPLGMVIFYFLASAEQSHFALGQALGFGAGAFMCIAMSDLLPELQFHRHDRFWLSIALVAGIALAWSTGLLEG